MKTDSIHKNPLKAPSYVIKTKFMEYYKISLRFSPKKLRQWCVHSQFRSLFKNSTKTSTLHQGNTSHFSALWTAEKQQGWVVRPCNSTAISRLTARVSPSPKGEDHLSPSHQAHAINRPIPAGCLLMQATFSQNTHLLTCVVHDATYYSGTAEDSARNTSDIALYRKSLQTLTSTRQQTELAL